MPCLIFFVVETPSLRQRVNQNLLVTLQLFSKYISEGHTSFISNQIFEVNELIFFNCSLSSCPLKQTSMRSNKTFFAVFATHCIYLNWIKSQYPCKKGTEIHKQTTISRTDIHRTAPHQISANMKRNIRKVNIADENLLDCRKIVSSKTSRHSARLTYRSHRKQNFRRISKAVCSQSLSRDAARISFDQLW